MRYKGFENGKEKAQQYLREAASREIEKTGQSVNSLAKEIGISQPLLHNWLSGKRESEV